jgi:hypothetical protein
LAVKPCGFESRPGHLSQMLTSKSLDQVAESYVCYTLALGQIDPYHVDAFFGPPEWKDQAKGISLEEIIDKAGEARAAIGEEQIQTEPRAKFLAKQLEALKARAQLKSGTHFTFDEESSAVYDVIAPTFPDSHYADVVNQLQPLLPGPGTLAEKWETFRSQFNIPPTRLEALFTAGVDVAREQAKKFIPLPANESFEIELVSGEVWGAYNWFKGQAHSLIQVNTDLPMTVNRIIHLACHEGYPGHHVYNTFWRSTWCTRTSGSSSPSTPFTAPSRSSQKARRSTAPNSTSHQRTA